MPTEKSKHDDTTGPNLEWEVGSIKGVQVNEMVKHCDQRGWLAEIFRQDSLDKEIFPVMGYVSVTTPGEARGPHEHIHQTDFFAFLGPGSLRLRLWDRRADSETRGHVMTLNVGEVNPVAVAVPPGVVHGYINISTEVAYVMNFPNRLYAGKNKQEGIDEIRHENESSSPFSLQD
ncbi:MAG: dTDP-4-dehydrorhamnose 3,5-epimerase family protein [Verrucomicrobiota bacterium]